MAEFVCTEEMAKKAMENPTPEYLLGLENRVCAQHNKIDEIIDTLNDVGRQTEVHNKMLRAHHRCFEIISLGSIFVGSILLASKIYDLVSEKKEEKKYAEKASGSDNAC